MILTIAGGTKRLDTLVEAKACGITGAAYLDFVETLVQQGARTLDVRCPRCHGLAIARAHGPGVTARGTCPDCAALPLPEPTSPHDCQRCAWQYRGQCGPPEMLRIDVLDPGDVPADQCQRIQRGLGYRLGDDNSPAVRKARIQQGCQ